MKAKRIQCCLLFLGFLFCVNAQDKDATQSTLKKNAVSINLLGITPVAGVTYTRMMNDKTSVEIGLGFPSVGMGIKSYPTKIESGKLKFHWGLSTNLVFTKDEDVIFTNLPLGCTYFGKKNLIIGLDIGPVYVHEFNKKSINQAPIREFGPYGNFKIGFWF